MFKLLTHKSTSSSLRTYSQRLFNTLFKNNNNKEQYFRANKVSLRLSTTTHHQICNKIPFTPLLYSNRPRTLFHPTINFTRSTRSISSFPPRFHLSHQRTLKQMVALGGATLSFFILKPTLFYIINGAVAFGAYKLLKRLLDHLFPTFNIKKTDFPSTIRLTKAQTILYYKSIEQIKKANLNSIIGFSDPHSTYSKSVGRGKQQNSTINIEYWAISNLGNMEALVKVEGVLHNNDDIAIKDIEMYWPSTGQSVNIQQDRQSYKKPPIIEAEFRDID